VRRLTLGPPGPLDLLAVGAHADDIEIGGGATILRLLDEHPGSSILWMIASATRMPSAAAEARPAAAFSNGAASSELIVGNLPR
jgi:LmbE family N-acetylglucosaminyl deacetylase